MSGSEWRGRQCTRGRVSGSEWRGRQCVKGRVPLHSLPLTLLLTHFSSSIHSHSCSLSHILPLHSLPLTLPRAHTPPPFTPAHLPSHTLSPSTHPSFHALSPPQFTQWMGRQCARRRVNGSEWRVRVCAREGEREWVKGETVHEREGEQE